MANSILSLEAMDDITYVQVQEHRVFLKITDQFREEVIRIIDAGTHKLIIDLSKVNVMNSSGLGVLILARDMMQKKNGVIVLCGLLPMMQEIFTRMHLDSFFNITSDKDAALSMLKNK